MLPDQVSNPGPLTYESGALPTQLRGPARFIENQVNDEYFSYLFVRNQIQNDCKKSPPCGGPGLHWGKNEIDGVAFPESVFIQLMI